jgi:hypothetical protein
MRGVHLQPGQHEIEFVFRPRLTGFYISLGAIITALSLLSFLFVAPSSASDPQKQKEISARDTRPQVRPEKKAVADTKPA